MRTIEYQYHLEAKFCALCMGNYGSSCMIYEMKLTCDKEKQY